MIDDDANLLFTDYRSNDGQPLPLVIQTLQKLYAQHPNMKVASLTATGYGERAHEACFTL